jgi:hypothetical protein
VQEWISPSGDTAVFGDLDVSIKRGAQGDQLSDHLVQIFHDEVEVNRCPMALVASNNLLGAKVCKGGAIGEQVDWQVRACESDRGGAQQPLQRETEPPQ